MFTLKFQHLATGVTYREDFQSIFAAVEREEKLTATLHWSGGPAYGNFDLRRN